MSAPMLGHMHLHSRAKCSILICIKNGTVYLLCQGAVDLRDRSRFRYDSCASGQEHRQTSAFKNLVASLDERDPLIKCYQEAYQQADKPVWNVSYSIDEPARQANQNSLLQPF